MRLRASLGLVISGLFGLLFILAAGQGVYAALALGHIAKGTALIQNTRVQALAILGQMNADFGDMRIAQSNFLDAPPAAAAPFRAAAAKAAVALQNDLARYRPLAIDKEDIEIFAEIEGRVGGLEPVWRRVVALADSGQRAAAMQLFLGSSLESFNKEGDLIQAAVDDIKMNVSQEGGANLARIARTGKVIWVVLGLAALLAAGAMLLCTGYVVRPLRRMTAAMAALAKGQTETAIPGLGRGDELGAMAAALQVFKDGILRSRRLEAEAEAVRAEAAAERARLQQEAESGAERRLREATAGLAGGLRRLAGGDLSFALQEPLGEEFEALRHDLNAAVAQLAASIAAVSTAAESIGRGSQEVSRSADDLSRRTEQQAASLEQTAASLQRITGIVEASSLRVEEARRVAEAARTSAAHSGEVVREAIEAMQEIEDSSGRISSIIGVIDEIAFQTNLLALNAGVEAARAGEAGRGFAVVATEVRALAQRSAEAAREIKALIGRSSAQVEKGVDLVRSTGEALRAIQEHVQSINAGMEAITQSARQQSVGLAEVNSAVGEMDSVTQRNAAMVEETNAASSLLAQDSGSLLDVVRRFTIPAPRAMRSVAA